MTEPAASTAHDCPFCLIVTGAEPAAMVFADEVAVAFLDRRPLFVGHTLVVPRSHHVTLADVPADRIGPLFERVQRLSAAMEAGLGHAGTFVAMNNRISQSVAHLHVHVVPRNPKDGLRGFFWPRTRYDDDAHMGAVAAEVAAAYRRMQR